MLEQKISAVLAMWCEVINQRIEAKWGNITAIQGKSEVHTPVINIISNAIMATLEYSGSKAFQVEYGRGSLMDQNNPYLDEYLSSPEFNQWRLHSSRMPIMGRSEGEYTDLDGNTQYSSGAMQGLDLERDGDPRFQPKLGMHVIKEEIISGYPELILAIKEAVRLYTIEQLTMTTQIYL